MLSYGQWTCRWLHSTIQGYQWWPHLVHLGRLRKRCYNEVSSGNSLRLFKSVSVRCLSSWTTMWSVYSIWIRSIELQMFLSMNGGQQVSCYLWSTPVLSESQLSFGWWTLAYFEKNVVIRSLASGLHVKIWSLFGYLKQQLSSDFVFTFVGVTIDCTCNSLFSMSSTYFI
jgi:hypothetical protein